LIPAQYGGEYLLRQPAEEQIWLRRLGPDLPECAEHIAQLGLDLDIRRPIEGASIAEADYRNYQSDVSSPKVIILDEATAPLPKRSGAALQFRAA
jgi:hypothetical protein